MSTRLKWHIEGDSIMRGGLRVARIITVKKGPDAGRLAWIGMNFQRVGFASKEETLADAKWYHRYHFTGHKPNIVLKFRSGRVVEYY